MDQITVITDLLSNHGISPSETLQIVEALKSFMQSCPNTDAVNSLVDKVSSKAMSFWLIANSLK